VGRRLLKEGKKVAFDFEDWYSRDYLVPGRPVKLLKELERNALTNGLYCVAASRSMASALNKAYQTGKEITVIYNGFSVSETNNVVAKKKSGNRPSLIWFSRNIGPDRGLETLFEAIALLGKQIDLHLLGMSDPAYVETLKQKFPASNGHQLTIHNFIDHRELIPFLSGFDIGLAIEESQAESRQVTITNKILQYIQASLKVLATDTAGQQEVAGYFPDRFAVVPAKDPQAWAAGIDELINRASETNNVQNTFQEIFSWESQQEKYVKLLRNKKIYGSHYSESA
jgi:glycosyltransferase involved in cell wall biosynthesis